MKIRKYQYGAEYIPISREEIEKSQGTPATSKSPEEKQETAIQSAIIKVLEENGIPNDVDYFLGQAQSFLSDSSNIFSGKKTNTMSQLIRLRSLANRLQHNNALYKEAVGRLKSENTGSDVAISNEGLLYVYGGDSLQKITPSEYKKNSEDYRVLTNAELANLRERDPNLKFDESVLHDLSNSIGMKTIMTQVIDTINKFGTQKQKGYTVKQGDLIQKGLESLIGLGPDGHYEMSRSDQGPAPEDEKARSLAVMYLYRNLNENMKNVLKATTAAEGLDPTNVNDVTKLLQIAIYEHTDHSLEANYLKETTGKNGSGSGSGGEGLADKEGYGQTLLSGFGASRTKEIRTRDGSVSYDVQVKHNPLMDKNGEIVTGVATLDEVFTDLMKNGVVMDRNRLFFGDLAIDPNKSREVIVDATEGVDTIDVPVDILGNPDFDAAERYKKAEKEIKDKNITDPNELGEVYYKYRLPLDRQGNLMTGRFLAVHAKMSEDEGVLAGYDSKNGTIDRLTGDGRTKFKNDVNYANQGREKKNKVNINYGWIWNRGILSGTIFIPLYANQSSQAVLDERARTDKKSGTDYQMLQETYVDPRYNSGTYSPTQTKLQTSFGDL